MKTLRIGSMTRTARAREILADAGIRARDIKLTDSADGCVHALEVQDSDAHRAAALLNRAGIPTSAVNGR